MSSAGLLQLCIFMTSVFSHTSSPVTLLPLLAKVPSGQSHVAMAHTSSCVMLPFCMFISWKISYLVET